MNPPKVQLFLISFCIIFCSTIGCADSSDRNKANKNHGHDHDHSAEAHLSFDSLVKQICEHRDAIKAAFDADKQDEAHGPLHEIGHLIAKLPDAAAETDLAEPDWNQVKQASDKLMESFTKVDALFHGNKDGEGFADVEKDVSEAMAILEQKVAMLSSASGKSQP